MLVVKARNYVKSTGCHYIQLTTYKTMYAAVRLYMKLGFQIIEEVKPGAPIFKFNERHCLRVKHILPMVAEKEYKMLLKL